MKIALFGGGGFIGSTIADRLLLDGHSLRIFERERVLPYRKFMGTEDVQWLTGDFSSAYDVGSVIKGMDAVVHLVSTTLPKSSNDDPIFDVQTNVVATLQMLNAMVAHGVNRIIFISSGGTVYGNPEYLPIDEKHPTNPLVSYGITKLAIEKYMQMYKHLHGISSVTLRVANPYGERQRIVTAQGAVGMFLHRAISGIPIEIWGDGNVTRDYIHVSDVADAFAKAIYYSGDQRCLNISSGVGISLNELISMLEEVLGRAVAVRYLAGRPFDVPVSVLANELAFNELNWKPVVNMHDGLRRTATWIKSELESQSA